MVSLQPVACRTAPQVPAVAGLRFPLPPSTTPARPPPTAEFLPCASNLLTASIKKSLPIAGSITSSSRWVVASRLPAAPRVGGVATRGMPSALRWGGHADNRANAPAVAVARLHSSDPPYTHAFCHCAGGKHYCTCGGGRNSGAAYVAVPAVHIIRLFFFMPPLFLKLHQVLSFHVPCHRMSMVAGADGGLCPPRQSRSARIARFIFSNPCYQCKTQRYESHERAADAEQLPGHPQSWPVLQDWATSPLPGPAGLGQDWLQDWGNLSDAGTD